VVRGVFNLSGDVLQPGISRVAVLGSGTLAGASAAGQPLPLVADGESYSALLPGPGAFAATLEWGAPIRQTPGRASFTLPVPPAGSARATFDIPGDEADVHLSSGLVTARSAAGGRTLVDATLIPGSTTEVWWSMRDSAPVAAARETRALADVLTLMTIAEADIRMVALIDVSVLQGEPRTFDVRLPRDYELTAVTGRSLERSDPDAGGLVLTVTDPALRRHQFLVSLERRDAGGSFSLETGFVALPGVQRENGEIGLEGIGTLDLTATERDGLHRIDVRELSRPLHSLARSPMLAAFRYQRNSSIAPGLALDVKRFPDAGVLAAVADRVVATTLVTAEGRALTEVLLTIQNRAQPFLKVSLPPGAAMVSVDVGGESAKPVAGTDGTRVPLLRAGFRPGGPYAVSFVYMHPGTPFGRTGDLSMALPRMDIPISLLEWELFVPDNYAMKVTGGNLIDLERFPGVLSKDGELHTVGISEAVIVTVTGETPPADQPTSRKADRPSQNVINLQRRAAGVLPVRVDVPRTGTSRQFVKPLLVDQEAEVRLRYKRR